MEIIEIKTISTIGANNVAALHDCEFCIFEKRQTNGYTTIRFDRSKKKTDKSIGGGLCMMVNNKWATSFCIRERVSTRSYEILTVSFRPHYLPRELGQVTVILVYIPGPDNKVQPSVSPSAGRLQQLRHHGSPA